MQSVPVPIRPLLSQLRFKHLRLLLLISHTKNLHRAAEIMNITQPAVSKMLQDVEKILDVQIFERKARSIVPTELGKYVIDYASQSITNLDRFENALGNLKQGGYGVLSIGSIMAISTSLLPQAIAELKKRRPLIAIKVSTLTSDQLLAELEKNELDIVIGRLTNNQQKDLFEVEPLDNEELWAFANPTHPLTKIHKITLDKLHNQGWVLQQKTSPMRQVIDTMFQKNGFLPLQNFVETTSIFATLQIIRHSNMIAILPSSILNEDIERGVISKLPIEIPNPLDFFGIIKRRDVPFTSNAEEFASIIRELINGNTIL